MTKNANFISIKIWFSLKSKGDVVERLEYAISIFDLNHDGFITKVFKNLDK